ncbi:MAG: hypothetical protein MZV64_69615 [Ignavibacteriales bacterium]|nr:hypothetical protein [Ignavibacteriales bacterium]
MKTLAIAQRSIISAFTAGESLRYKFGTISFQNYFGSILTITIQISFSIINRGAIPIKQSLTLL